LPAIAHRPRDGDQAFFDAAQSRCLGQDQRRNGKSLSLTTWIAPRCRPRSLCESCRLEAPVGPLQGKRRL